jgi:hypothetical protein
VGRRKMGKNRILMIFTTFVMFFGLSYGIYVINLRPLSYVSISINPDVELAVNAINVVKEIIPINKDADIITSDLRLVGKTIDVATKSIIDASIETGYIDEYSDENTVVVTATGEDDSARSKLEDKVMKVLNNRLQEKNIYAVVVANGVNDTIKEEAVEYDISNGKMLLIDRAVAINSDLSKDNLATMSIKDIQSKIHDYVEERHEKMNLGTEKQIRKAMKKEKQVLKALYQEKVEALKTTLLDDTGVNIDELTEDEKNDLIEEQLNNRKNEIKESIDKVKEEVKDSLKDTTTPTDIKNIVDDIRNQFRNKKND